MSQTIGHGSKLQLGSGGGSETFTTINGVVSIDLGSNKIDTVDNTDLGTIGPRTFVGALEDSGDITAKVNVIPGDVTQTSLFTAKDGAAHDWKIVYPGATRTISCAGIITSIDESIPDDKLPTYTLKIKISGANTNS